MARRQADASKNPTIYDVAAAAEVSASTVSRTFSNPERVNPTTAEHVLEVAARIGYRSPPRAVPEGRRTKTVGLFLTDIANPVYPMVVKGCETSAEAAGYSVMVFNTNESPRMEVQAITRAMTGLDGVILASSRMDDQDIRDFAGRIPLVSVNRSVTGVRSVVMDNRGGAEQAVTHLAALGHTRIHYLAGPETSWANRVRWRTISALGADLNLEITRTAASPPTISAGAQHAEYWTPGTITGVIAFNDLVAVGFIAGLVSRGIEVPASVSIVGFDNSPVADIVSPGLTTVASPLRLLSASAVENVLAMVRGEDLTRTDTQVFITKLIERGTTARIAG